MGEGSRRRHRATSQPSRGRQQRQAAEAEGTTHALGLPRPRRTSSPNAGSRCALGLSRPKRPVVGHRLGTVKGTLAPPRYECGLEGKATSRFVPRCSCCEAAAQAAGGRGAGAVLCAEATGSSGGFVFLFQGAVVEKQPNRLQEAEVQEQCCV